MKYFILAFNNYANFKDRTTRKEYWMFILVNLLLQIGLGIACGILGLGEGLVGLFGLVMFIPSISIAARRLHDTGRSGWWQLISLIPLIGLIILIVFLVGESKEDNEYGAKRTEELSTIDKD